MSDSMTAAVFLTSSVRATVTVIWLISIFSTWNEPVRSGDQVAAEAQPVGGERDEHDAVEVGVRARLARAGQGLRLGHADDASTRAGRRCRPG